MADIQLTKPAANQTQTVTSAADARFVLNFAAGEAKLSKSDNGENLILTFDDGAKIEVEGFYTTFGKDNLPTLQVNGQDITGDQLTAILGEDLMPAAGPAASGGIASAGGSNVTFENFSLDEGIDRIGGLDIGFTDSVQLYDNPEYGSPEYGSPGGYYALAGGAPVDYLKAQDDAETGGIMNSVTLSNLVGNDTLGTVNASSVRGFTVVSDGTRGGRIEMDGNDLRLTLDDKSLEDSLYESGAAVDIIAKKRG